MSSNDAVPPIPADIVAIAGPLLLGHMLNWGLFGALSVQIYMYHIGYPEDSRFNRLFVAAIYVWEAVQTFVLTDNAFDAFARGYGNVNHLDRIGHLWFSVPVMSGVVAFAGQAFYAYRISILAQSRIMSSIILLLAFISLGGSIACGVEAQKAGLHSRFLSRDSYITAGIWNGGSALCDAIIAVCMTVYLQRRDTGVNRVTTVLRKLIRVTLETGTVTAGVAILNLVLMSLPGRPSYYLATVGILGKLYANSAMAVFNSRPQIDKDGRDPSEIASSLSTFNAGPRSIPNVQSTYEMTARTSITELVSSSSAGSWSEDSPFQKNGTKLKGA